MAKQKDCASFDDVQEFFKSWGMYPAEEVRDMLNDQLNPEVIQRGINQKCYEKLLKEAKQYIRSSKYGDYFAAFCRISIGAADDAYYLDANTWQEYYLDANTWQELQEDWENYITSL